MLDDFDALIALAEHKTMQRAARALHITQSAVSKRIANLQIRFGRPLIEPRGRRVELTPFALQALHRVRPLVSELKELFIEESSAASGTIVLDMSVSVLISWGARALAQIKKANPAISFRVNANHASVAVERVRGGESMVAVVQGESKIAPDLTALHVTDQAIVIVPSGLKPFRFPRSGILAAITIEPHTEAWAFMADGLKEIERSHGVKVEAVSTLQSFSAIVQMARVGFGHGLAPYEVARTLGVPDRALVPFPEPGVKVPVSLIGRRSTLSRPLLQEFYNLLLKQL